MRKFAFFLPQFHSIPENDEWWGKNFTEWTNLEKALSLYKGHCIQTPLNHNYYNLLDKKTVEWQTNLMNNYRIDGLIYYHYYFSGHLLLEKPAENLLRWKEIDQPFFFCWANHSWKRTWNGESTVLMEQTYGNEEQWNQHFEYLLPFFKDPRYEKKDNKPLFMIFLPLFDEKQDMMQFFDKKCKENGFDGICVIESNNEYAKQIDIQYPTHYLFQRQASAALNLYNGNNRFSFGRIFRKMKREVARFTKMGIPFSNYNGDTLFKLMIKNVNDDKRVIPGLAFRWDNTPRHKERGYIITSPSKENFIKYMDKIKDSEYVFINAWNEWCEGMVLEPTEQEGYKYLEWIKEWSEDIDSKN